MTKDNALLIKRLYEEIEKDINRNLIPSRVWTLEDIFNNPFLDDFFVFNICINTDYSIEELSDLFKFDGEWKARYEDMNTPEAYKFIWCMQYYSPEHKKKLQKDISEYFWIEEMKIDSKKLVEKNWPMYLIINYLQDKQPFFMKHLNMRLSKGYITIPGQPINIGRNSIFKPLYEDALQNNRCIVISDSTSREECYSKPQKVKNIIVNGINTFDKDQEIEYLKFQAKKAIKITNHDIM